MNLPYLIIMLLIDLALLVVFGGGALILLIALFTRRWKLAAGTGAGLALGLATLLMFMSRLDPYMRTPVTSTQVVGTYRAAPAAARRLGQLGYGATTGELVLKADGSFAATELPACCVNGDEALFSATNGGRFTLAGTWEVEFSSEMSAVRLTLTQARRSTGASHQPGSSEPNAAPASLTLRVLKGTPPSLAVQIFNGDFYDLVYEAASNR